MITPPIILDFKGHNQTLFMQTVSLKWQNRVSHQSTDSFFSLHFTISRLSLSFIHTSIPHFRKYRVFYSGRIETGFICPGYMSPNISTGISPASRTSSVVALIGTSMRSVRMRQGGSDQSEKRGTENEEPRLQFRSLYVLLVGGPRGMAGNK